jgi:hypothetical protein
MTPVFSESTVDDAAWFLPSGGKQKQAYCRVLVLDRRP